MLFRQADGMHSVVMILLKSLQSVTTPKCPVHFHTSTGISSLPPTLPHFIPLSALTVSASLTGLVMPGWTPCPRSPLVDSFIHEPVEILAPSPSDVFIFHQHLSCCTFDGSNLSNVLSCSVPSRCDRPYTHYY